MDRVDLSLYSYVTVAHQKAYYFGDGYSPEISLIRNHLEDFGGGGGGNIFKFI